MARVRKLAMFKWSSTDLRTQTYSINIINELLRSLSELVNYSNWKHFRYDHVQIRLTVNTSRFFKGAMLVSTVPGAMASFYDINYQPFALSQLPSSILDATATACLEVSIPWLSPFVKQTSGFFATDDTGFLTFSVLSPLGSETAVGVDVEADVSIEANFVKPMLIDPYPGTFPVPALRPRIKHTLPVVAHYYTQGPGKRGVVNEANRKAERGTLASFSESVSSISSSLTSVPIIGPFAQGISLISSSATKFFDWLGLSKPNNTSVPLYTLNSTNPYSQTFHGLISAQPLSSDLVPYVSTDPHLLADHEDGCNLMKIATTPSLMRSTPIKVLVDADPVVCESVAVSPVFGHGLIASFAPSNVAYAASFYGTWRGEMAYKIYIPASIMSRQRIIITHTINKPTSWSQFYRSQYYEVQGSTVIDLVLPWIQKEPYLECPQLDSRTDNPAPNGYLTIWAATSLINDNPGVTPTPLLAHIFTSATANTQFAVFRSPTRNRNVVSSMLQGSFGANNSGVIDGIVAEDDITSIREIAHRPSLLAEIDIAAGGRFTMPRTFSPFLRYILAKYRFWRGSINIEFKFSGDTPMTRTILVHRYDNVETTDTQIVWDPAVCSSLIVNIPYTQLSGYSGTGGLQTAIFPYFPVIDATPSSGSANLRAYISFSDDLSLGVQTFSPYVVDTS